MSRLLKEGAPEVAAADPAVLRRISDAEIGLVRWSRMVPAALAAVLAGTDLFGFTRHHLEGTPGEVARDWPAALATAGLPRRAATLLAADAADLAGRFAATVSAARVRLRLERITGDSCRRFHADYMAARLITTYRGVGTQWLDRSAAAQVRDGQVPNGTPISQLAAGEVAIMKGRLWPPGPPLVHRSPPIAGSGTDRLVLAIDVVSAPGDLT